MQTEADRLKYIQTITQRVMLDRLAMVLVVLVVVALLVWVVVADPIATLLP